MKRYLSILCLLISASWVSAQMSNDGALISIKDGAMMSVHEEVVNYNDGEFHNTDTIYLFDDWTNNAGNEAFISLGIGIVHLYGADQRIKGTDITRFYDLRLEQTGVKYGDIDVYVDGFLRLNDRQFHMDTNCVSVFNSQQIAVENIGEGYVSALLDGGLMRNLESIQPYFYPVGWPNMYRPLELTMNTTNLNQMKVRMAFGDATSEGYDRSNREPALCDIISTFSHRVHQISGTDNGRVKIHYNEAIDGFWTTIAHYQNMPQWEDTGDQDAGIDPVTGLDYFNTIAYNTNFSEPACALATDTDTLPLFADDTMVCQGKIVTFTAEAGYLSYEFFVNGISVQVGPSNTYVTGTVQAGDIVTYQATDADCTYESTEVVMMVAPLPTALASSNSPVCENTNLELYSSGGISYEWEGPNTFSSTGQNPIINNTDLLATGIYTVTVTNGDGCSATANANVTILPAPTATVSSNSPICLNEDVELYADGGVSYEWEGPSGYISTDQNPILTSPSLLANGIYTVTVTNGDACTSTASTDVIINDLPNPTASNDSPVCLGGDVTLSATGGTSYGWSGSDGFTSTDQNPILTNTTLAANGTYTVTVTDGNSCTATAETIVVIFDLPIVIATSNSPVCNGDSLQLLATGGVSYNWEGPNTFVSMNQNPVINPVATLAAGTYTVTITDGNGCTNITSTEVIINELPVVTVGSNSPVCVNETILLNANGGISYAWTGPNGFTDSAQNPTITPATLANGGTYTVIVTDGNTCSSIDTVAVVVNDLPVPIVTNNSPVCIGEDIILGVTGGTAYNWEGPNGFASTDQNPLLTSPDLLYNGTYTVTVTDGNSCSTTAETIVIINDLPTVSASNNSPICDGTALVLSAQGGTSYEWEGPSAFASSAQNPTINPASLINPGIYTVTVTDGNGCTNTATTLVIINDLPVVTIGSNSPVCLNETIFLNADGGVSYSWTGPNGFTDTAQNPSIVSASSIHAGTYVVTIIDGNGCVNTNSVDVIVNDLPIATAANDSPVCMGFDVQLSASGGTSYVWSDGNGFSSMEQNPVFENVDVTDAGIYIVTVTDGNGCTSSASTEIMVFPEVVEVATNNTPLCLGETVQLAVTGDPTWTYEWSSNADGGFNSTEQNPSFVSDNVFDSGTYVVTVTDGNACTGVFSTIVIVSDFPQVGTITDAPVCEFASIQITTTYEQNWTYEWEGPNNFIDTISNPFLETVTEDNEGFYYVTVSNATGCETYDTIYVEVYDDLMGMPYGDTLIYETQSTPIGVTEGTDFIWNPSGTLDCPICQDVIATPDETTTYNVIVTDKFGCLDTFAITVEVEIRTDDDLIVPNTITPNGDGKNDAWVIPWLDRFPENSVVILNRWGDEIFFDKPYENNFEGKFEGRDLPPGTYYYILQLGENFRPFKGPLTIIRE